jgi:hypothetical protein
MQSKHVIASVVLGAALVAGNAGASDRQPVSRWENYGKKGIARGRTVHTVPEFGAGAVGSAAAVVVGGLMALSGYRRKRRLD